MVLYLIIGLMLVTGAFLVLTPTVKEPPLPNGCGLTDINQSETESHMAMVTKTMQEQHTYYRDLVCINGTMVLKYREGE